MIDRQQAPAVPPLLRPVSAGAGRPGGRLRHSRWVESARPHTAGPRAARWNRRRNPPGRPGTAGAM